MCKSISEGGDRCNAHTSERQVSLESSLQSKILKTLPEEERQKLDNTLQAYDKFVEISRAVDGAAVPITEEDNDDVLERASSNHAWNVSALKRADLIDKHYHYRSAVEEMENPSYSDKVNYLRQTNPQFQKIDAEMNKIDESIWNRTITPAESERLAKLSAKASAMVPTVQPLTKSEIQTLIDNNPYTKPRDEAIQKNSELSLKLQDHYRKEQVYNRSEAYRKAYNEYAKTPAGQKMMRKIAENEVHESISKQSLEGAQRRINVYKHRNDEERLSDAQNNLLMRKSVASAYQFQNKYAYVKKQMAGSQDVKDNIILPLGVSGKTAMVQTETQYEQTMVRADEVYGSKFEGQSPEKRRRLVEKELYEKKGVTSVKAIMNNPSIQSSLEDISGKQEEIRERLIDFKAGKIARKHSGEEDVQIANLRRNLFDYKV